MEGPVLTESEVWKVDEPKTDYPPLANDGDEDFSKATPLVSEHTAKEAEKHEETSPDLPEPDLGSEVDSINEKICKDRRVIQTENKQKSLLDESNQKINHEENKHENNKEENKEMKKGNIEEIKHEMNQEKGENDQSEKQQGNRQDYCQVENRDNSVDKQEIISEIQQPIVQELDQGVNQKNTTGVKHQENCVENTQQNKQDMDNPELGVNKEDNLDGKQEVKKENNQEDHEEDSVEINQEITILVTSHDCGTEDEEDEKQTLEELEPEQEPVLNVETEDECLDGSIVVANMIEVSEVQTTNLINCTSTSNNEDVVNSKKETNSESTDSSFAQKNEAANMDSNTPDSVSSLKDQADVNQNKSQNKTETLSLSRSPGRTQTVQTQVSLEVMYQSVATSPMTPPEGSTGFIFPTTFGKFASKTVTESFNTKDAEMQAGLQPEFRSVATAPMTPLVLTAPELIPEPEPRIGVSNEEKPEPVQEVSWDEKGMTWEVYGAAVEVAVLGTAIQKHLEKQVKKKKPAPIEVIPEDMNETSAPMPSSPPPVLELSENVPEESEEKPEQRSRHQDSRFRRWLRNILRPRCCSRARGDKDD